jgi:hypothetical protein
MLPLPVHEPTASKRFVTAYNQLDQYLRATHNSPGWPSHESLLIGSDKIPGTVKPRLRTYANLRNAIVHSEPETDDQPIAEPHLEEVEHYERLVHQILNPPTVMSCVVPVQSIFSVSREDNVFRVIREMNEKVYTHAPLLEGGCVTGVFSENTVFSYLGHHCEAILDAELTLASFEEFLPIDSHTPECFKFISRDAPLSDAAQVFKDGLKSRSRVGAIFVTENGKQKA